ncbi:MAG: slipin family protein, partial [Bacteroidetes bacterium]
MKLIHVNAHQKALVFKRGDFVNLLHPGQHWLWSGQTVHLFDTTKPFVAPVDLHILLQHAAVHEALHVVQVNEQEIMLLYENGLLKQVLTTGWHAFWKGIVQYQFAAINIGQIQIDDSVGTAILQHKLVA